MVAITGIDRGISIVNNILNSLAPSIRADSLKEAGIVERNVLITTILKKLNPRGSI
jgi:hypothetical protein